MSLGSWGLKHTCLYEWVGPNNYARYMAGILVKLMTQRNLDAAIVGSNLHKKDTTHALGHRSDLREKEK